LWYTGIIISTQTTQGCRKRGVVRGNSMLVFYCQHVLKCSYQHHIR